MYCFKCGKEISDNSDYCQFCGTEIHPVRNAAKLDRKGIFSFFRNMSRGAQTAWMVYVIWFLLWIIFWITDVYYDDNGGVYFLIFGISIPLLIFFVWYCVTNLWRDKFFKEEKSDALTNNGESVYTLYPLLEFARIHGKMQVAKGNANGVSISLYCLFTNDGEEPVRVDFAKNMEPMTAEEISLQKRELSVVCFPDGHYELSHTDIF